MKDINKLSIDLYKVLGKITDKVLETHEESVNKVYKDVLNNAPTGFGDYVSSIKRYPSEITKHKVISIIGTDIKTEDGYFLGRIIENGTGTYALEPHIGHTKTFIESGYRMWYIPVVKAKYVRGGLQKINIGNQQFYVGKPEPPHPHFRNTLEKNKLIYKNNIINAIKEELK